MPDLNLHNYLSGQFDALSKRFIQYQEQGVKATGSKQLNKLDQELESLMDLIQKSNKNTNCLDELQIFRNSIKAWLKDPEIKEEPQPQQHAYSRPSNP